ncbi:MCP four helix bundle domain-containing protein [Lewinella cohaerens]|uniref:MCP four helix bundle domain-containing protein n=1 Tax=Lewinella cohaerens TaxID=70995 RepID=UPI0003656BE8|nr:MCP four helix bundle domain-containing protein [Lewinella cohaerens]
MTVYNKIKWTLGILSVFFIILATNLIDRKNFNIVKNSVETIYADRLLAQDILLDLSKLTWEKELAQIKYERSQFENKNIIINTRIDELINLFAVTKLTPKEKVIFEQLKKNFISLKEYELNEIELPSPKFSEYLALVKDNLDDLSEIQIEEGKRELFQSKRAIASVDLFTHLEIYALIIIAIFIQIVVMYNPKKEGNS